MHVPFVQFMLIPVISTQQGSPRCHAVMTLFVSWMIVAVCLIKGVRSSGRVVYFTSFFPYVVLAALAVRSFSLPGAADGIVAYVTPRWDRLANVNIWVDAATQVSLARPYFVHESHVQFVSCTTGDLFAGSCLRLRHYLVLVQPVQAQLPSGQRADRPQQLLHLRLLRHGSLRHSGIHGTRHQ